LTVGILEENPLAPIRITTTRDFYDFDAKYKGPPPNIIST